MPYDPPPELASLSLGEIAGLVAARKLPPVDQWSPADEGDSEMRIAADGRWYHQGGEIRRPAMVRAFASLLMCDGQGQHWLVTPTQKLSIAVEDAAFMAIDVTRQDDTLTFRLNTDDFVIAGPDHPITAQGDAETPALYLAVRHGTRARLNRSTYAQVIDMALDNEDGPQLAVMSGGLRFALIPE
ncbi:DUF1285 domain-containing protein [Novosphingobium sp. Leaf2]|uniref:DUF1285 domain-containing protein n=1 Tax=Novosphingobium sp. Leaf2 TaxID=1735670 RepID=UPI0006F71454|nr:DUF1285 domain-containing protein [Novosphingobium sp. Leaf2]KQM17347.1 hypothetical protein ASE49_09780 [Novosphingobium sp. Leaf2]